MTELLPVLALIPVFISLDNDASEAFRLFALRVRESLRHADLSIEKAALWMEMDPAQLQRQLAGIGHLSLRRLVKLPDAFHQWLALLTVEAYGLPKAVAPVEHLMGVTRPRMARMDMEKSA